MAFFGGTNLSLWLLPKHQYKVITVNMVSYCGSTEFHEGYPWPQTSGGPWVYPEPSRLCATKTGKRDMNSWGLCEPPSAEHYTFLPYLFKTLDYFSSRNMAKGCFCHTLYKTLDYFSSRKVEKGCRLTSSMTWQDGALNMSQMLQVWLSIWVREELVMEKAEWLNVAH